MPSEGGGACLPQMRSLVESFPADPVQDDGPVVAPTQGPHGAVGTLPLEAREP